MTSQYSIQRRFSAAILASPVARAHELEKLAVECGCLLRQFGEDCDFLLIARHSESEADAGDWSEIADYLDTNDGEAVIWSNLEGLDAAYAALPTDRCHFLVDTADWQAVAILTGVSKRARIGKLHDISRDDEMVTLHQISGELADFARTPARIAVQDESGSDMVRDKPVGFRPVPPNLFDGFGKPRSRQNSSVAERIRAIIKQRRLRERYFDAALFADPGWDILLDLYAAQDERVQVSVSSLCIAASVPPTTALRWITNMTGAGLLVRVQDPEDARRVFIELSPAAKEQLDRYFEATSEMHATAI
jgi:DNA-binding MarR family transcriptional regulator